jgi:hypothetical protein
MFLICACPGGYGRGERERERESKGWCEVGGAWEGEDKWMNAKLIYQIVEEERH